MIICNNSSPGAHSLGAHKQKDHAQNTVYRE